MGAAVPGPGLPPAGVCPDPKLKNMYEGMTLPSLGTAKAARTLPEINAVEMPNIGPRELNSVPSIRVSARTEIINRDISPIPARNPGKESEIPVAAL